MYLLKPRHDIRKEVQFLASKSNSPTISDRNKLYRVLAYLNSTPTLSSRYYTTDGPTVFAYFDASYSTHTDGRSQTGFFLSIGRGSAPSTPMLVSSNLVLLRVRWNLNM